MVRSWCRDALLGALPIIAILWIFDVPLQLGIVLVEEELLLAVAGIACAVALLRPGEERGGLLGPVLAVVAIASWGWLALHFSEWLLNPAARGPEKWIPALLALMTLFEAVRRSCGLVIALIFAVFGIYAFAGHLLPGLLQAPPSDPRRVLLYLTVDANGVPGQVLGVATTLVLAFLVFSGVLHAAGAGQFFDDLATSLLGRFRGGPAKVAILSSCLFGIISGSSVANVVSSGSITIPLMKRSGVKPSYAAGIEAVASNGSQLMPPVMGATAFLIAEFLQIPYAEVALAAAVPAVLIYLLLYVQVDAYAGRNRLAGRPKSELPRAGAVLVAGGIFLLPVVVLIYAIFWGGQNVSKGALAASAVMLAAWVVRRRIVPGPRLLWGILVEAGASVLPILLVSAGAGVLIGVLNFTGLGFKITLLLSLLGEHWGIFALLLATAALCLLLGLGMPTAGVYVLLSVVLAPAIVKFGVEPLSAHLFIFYFGLLSMLTPPVAMASYAAASIAGCSFSDAGWMALRLAAPSFLLPFVFVFNPALVLHGTVWETAVVAITVLIGGTLVAWAIEGQSLRGRIGQGERAVFGLAGLGISAATLVFGSHDPRLLLYCGFLVLVVAGVVWTRRKLRNPAMGVSERS